MAVLGIDYGERRIGVAISDDLEMIASPFDTLQNDDTLLPRLKQIVAERNVREVVVGLPLNMDGTQGASAKKAVRFAQKLEAELDVGVETFDERLTTVQAERSMLRHDISRARRAKRIDEMAAQIMLQCRLDAASRKKSRRSGDQPAR